MKKIFTILSLFLVVTLNAQQTAEFETTIYVMDLNGNMDSVVVGYDFSATDDIDTQFGEVDITSQPWDSILEVRVSPHFTAQGDKLCKKQIAPLNCNTTLPKIGIVVLSIHANTPVVFTWNTQDFQDDCRDSSVIVEDEMFFQYPQLPYYRESYMAYDYNHGATFKSPHYYYSFYESNNIEGGGTDTIYNVFIGFVDDMDELVSTNNQKQIQQQTKAFPNPTTDKFTIQLPENYESESVQVFDITGRQIYQNTEQNNQIEVPSSTWAKGVYFYRVELEDGIFVNGRIIKQ